MKQSVKIAFSLLISTILFSGFALLAFSGLFTMVETKFFNPRIKDEYQQSVDAIHSHIKTYHEQNIAHYAAQLVASFVPRAFRRALCVVRRRPLHQVTGDGA